jgi:DNA polymerase-1
VDEARAFIREIWRRLETGDGLVANSDKVLVVDIEVDIEKDTAFDHPNQYGMLCVGIGYDKSKVVVFSESVMGSQQIRDELGDLLRGFRIVAQNGKFDLAGLYPLVGSLDLYFDTMLASYVFDERPGIHGLKYMAVEYLGTPQYDEEIKKYVGPKDGYGAIPRDLLYKYNAYDVACTYDMYLLWNQRFSSADNGAQLRQVHDFLVAASNQLMYVELNGITVDREYLKKLDAEYLERLHAIEDELDIIVQKDYDKRGGINPRSPMQVKAYLSDMGIKVDTTAADTLELIQEKTSKPDASEEYQEVNRFVSTMLKHRREAKLHGTYVKGIAKRMYRGRVYPTFLLHGTTTGRLACRNPNMQNIPRESSIRKLFVPSKHDHVFVQTDYSQAELRVLSYLAKDTYFRDIFNDGTIDVFDDLTPILYPHADRSQMTKEEWKELRIRVKAYVYGVSYGRSEFSIASEFDISVREARAGMERFFSVIPEIVDFRNNTRQRVLEGGDLVTPWGRRRRYALITDENKDAIMNEALAFMPQSTASDMCVQALTWTRPQLKGLGWIRNIVHDSLLVECHEEDAEEVTAIIEKNMIDSAKTIVGDYVKFAVESTVGKSWGDV